MRCDYKRVNSVELQIGRVGQLGGNTLGVLLFWKAYENETLFVPKNLASDVQPCSVPHPQVAAVSSAIKLSRSLGHTQPPISWVGTRMFRCAHQRNLAA